MVSDQSLRRSDLMDPLTYRYVVNNMIWIWYLIFTYLYTRYKNKNRLMLRSLNWFAWVFSWLYAMHEVNCMNWNTGKVISLIGEWESEDSNRLDATYLCKLYLCWFTYILMNKVPIEIVLVRLSV